jgi:ferredoxin-NADP reductase
MVLLKLFLLPLCVTTGFSPIGGGGVRNTSYRRHRHLQHQVLFAEGAPQYQKQMGILQRSEAVGRGSYLLYIDYDKSYNNEEEEENEFENGYYQPGHVLALEIQPPPATTDDSLSSSTSFNTTMNEKTKRDLNNNDGWLRGPYTVSRGYGSSNSDSNDEKKNSPGFQVLIKEVGYKSNVLATSIPGTPVQFGGRFKVPIVEGIRMASQVDNEDDEDDLDTTKRVVMISTGVGIGPCIGAIELLLFPSADDDNNNNNNNNNIAIDLIASFRTQDEIAMTDDLNRLQSDARSLGKQFNWKAVITEEVGRLSLNSPDVLRERYLQRDDSDDDDNLCMIRNTHYHIIGNGQLVNEWTKGLAKAGVAKKRVTSEAYFNHAAESDDVAINNICDAILLGENDDDDEERKNRQLVTAATTLSTSSSSVKQ